MFRFYLHVLLALLVVSNVTAKLFDRSYKDPRVQCGRDECGGALEIIKRRESGGPVVCIETPGFQQRFSAEDPCMANCTVKHSPTEKIHEDTIECLCKKACPLDHVRYCAAPGECGLWGQECDKVCTGEAKYYGDQCQHPCDCNENSPHAVC